MANKEIDKRVHENKILLTDYSPYHDTWKNQAKLNRDYVFNKQWTDDEVEVLNERGQAPTVINRIHPVVEQKLAIMAARDPGVRCLAREDSDVKVAKLLQDIMQYIWYISDGTVKYRQALSDCIITGLGFMYCYLDKYADDGFGEVKFGYAHGEDVYVDPNSKDPLFSDAENILIVKYPTREQLKMRMPDKASKIDKIAGTAEPYTTSNMYASDGQTVLGDVGDTTTEKIEVIERYQKIRVKFVKFAYEDNEGQIKEEVLESKEFADWVKKNGVPIKSFEFFRTRVKMILTAGDDFMYEYVLPISEYPIVPFSNVYTGSPYSMGDPAFLIGIQDLINKMYSLMIAHATTSTSPKVLLPKGSVEDRDELEKQWSKPGSIIEYLPEQGAPVPVPPVPLPNALYQLAADGKYEVEYGSGIFALMQGSSQQTPNTYRGILALEEFGNRRITYRLKTVELALSRLFQVALEYAQSHYTIEKTFRIVEPNGIPRDIKVNIPSAYDQYGKVVERINDITAGKYDVIVIAGSTLPSNRWALAEEYLKWYQMGLIDDVEVLKKLDIFDREGVLERKSQIGQLMNQNQQLVGTVEEMSKQLAKMQREQTDHEKQLELTEFKAKVDAYLDRIKNSVKLYDSMLKNRTKTLQKEYELNMKDTLQEQASSPQGE